MDESPMRNEHEGYLVKRTKLVGFKKYFVVLKEGQIIYYSNEANAKSDESRKGVYSLRNASIKNSENSIKGPSFTITYEDGTKHSFSMKPFKTKSTKNLKATQTNWIDALNKQINISLLSNDKSKSYNCITDNRVIGQNNQQFGGRSALNIVSYNRSVSHNERGNYGVFDESTQDVNSGQVVQMRRLTNDSTNTDETSTNNDMQRDESFSSSSEGPQIKPTIDSGFYDDDDDYNDNNDAECPFFSCSSSLSSLSFTRSNENLDPYGFRLKLPTTQIDKSQVSVWDMVKHFIGKDLTRISIPVIFSEPLSLLQKLMDGLEYTKLLNRACIEPDPIKRLVLVSCFALSPSSSLQRFSKPFNPILGETFEFNRDDMGVRCIAEQVSHHPPVSAYHSNSTNPKYRWRFYGQVRPDMKFYGKSLGVEAKAHLAAELSNYNETYVWKTSGKYTVSNILFGTPKFECHGEFEVVCQETGYKVVINFKPNSKWRGDSNRVEAYVYDQNNKKRKVIYGYWTHCLYSCDVNSYEKACQSNKKLPTTQFDQFYNPIIPFDEVNNNLLKDLEEIWTINPKPTYANQYYNFSYFTMSLNQLKPELERLLPPTDSRFRPDVRQLEEGNLDLSSNEKYRLEEKQRAAARMHAEESNPYRPKWFDIGKHKYSDDEIWLFNNTYWQRDYIDCPDIY